MSRSKPKLALVLGSGASKGLAHIGLIKALKENNIPIDLLVGSSAGAIVAAFYAKYQDTKLVEEFLSSLNYRRLLSLLLERPNKKAVLAGNRAFAFIEKNLSGNIQDFPLPLYIVSSDLVTGQPYVFSSGDVITALKASSAIPLVFPPQKFEDHFLIDGGAIQPLPVATAKKLNPDFIIASSLHSSLFPQDLDKLSKANFSTIALKASQLMIYTLVQESAKQADFHFQLDIPTINTLNFVKAKSFIDLAYQQTILQIPKLKTQLHASFPSLQF